MEASAHGAPAGRTAVLLEAAPQRVRVPMLRNYLFCAIAGTTWYFQFFFYSMGETQMGVYKFSSWTLHMASIIIFSSLWGLGLHEWRGASKRTMRLLTLSLFVLVGSTLIVGYGNYLGSGGIGH
jgi:L-rhamnose-H+ transport protein